MGITWAFQTNSATFSPKVWGLMLHVGKNLNTSAIVKFCIITRDAKKHKLPIKHGFEKKKIKNKNKNKIKKGARYYIESNPKNRRTKSAENAMCEVVTRSIELFRPDSTLV